MFSERWIDKSVEFFPAIGKWALNCYFSGIMKKILIFLPSLLLLSAMLFAQEGGVVKEEAEIDPSKPTNLYTQVNVQPEYQDGKADNLYGARIAIQYAINPDNLLMAEVPFLYNDKSEKSGLSDIRVRYFRAVRRNITKKFIAVAPFTDISLPVGSYEKGLGTGSWSIAAGVVGGFVVSSKFAIFPGISYIHVTRSSTDFIPDSLKFASNGVGLQLNGSYSFSKRTFIFINPIPSIMNTNGDWKAIWSGEFSLNRIFIPNKFKANFSFNPNFTSEIYIYRLGATFFL